MSDHSKPRRWTLECSSIDGSSFDTLDGPRCSRGSLVPVREDCITEADVEALGDWLDEFAADTHAETDGRDRLDDARKALSAIFKEGS